MGLFKVLKKREVPAELPGLSMSESQSPQNTPVPTPNQSSSYKPLPVQSPPKASNKEHIKSEKISQEDKEKGFFRDLMQELTSDIDKSNMEDWSKNQFLTEDIVSQMKNYWEGKKPDILMRNVSSELKTKLKQKTEQLDTLEKEWQELYFALQTKETKIREEEKELKTLISELTQLFENSIKIKKKKK